MIVGGASFDKWVMILLNYFSYEDSHILLSLETEVWDFENGDNQIITPYLYDYYYGIGLYAVDFNFCSNWIFLI